MLIGGVDERVGEDMSEWVHGWLMGEGMEGWMSRCIGE